MKRIYLLLFFLPLVLSSCSSLYMPNVPNTPMFSSKGELQASGHLSLKGNLSFNSAWAFSDNFAIMVNGSRVNNNREKKDFKHSLVEAGLGYFSTFGPENNRVIEVYAGMGNGNSTRISSDLTYDGPVPYETLETTFSKYFLQTDYSSKNKKKLRLFGTEFPLNYGTALRISYVTMNDFRINGLESTKEDNIFLEPVFYTRMQLTDKLQLQYSSGSNFGLINRKYLTAGSSVFTIGAVLTLAKKQ